MSGPRVTSGPDSKSDYATPRVFLDAVAKRFEPIAFDLAAHKANARHPRFFADAAHPDGAEGINALGHLWRDLAPGGLLWLNPPFSDIATWAEKCAVESILGTQILFLVPASVGSNWFRDHVANHADVYLLGARIRFDGAKDLYPKDLMLAHFRSQRPHKIALWKWTEDVISAQWQRLPEKHRMTEGVVHVRLDNGTCSCLPAFPERTA